MANTYNITTHSPEETQALASRIGQAIKGGEVIELMSDVGAGKTTFVRGLVQGIGSTDAVASPTFTISRVYGSDDLTVAHFDFYRLHEPGLIQHELSEYLDDHQVVTVVEWPDNIKHVLPKQRMKIHITSDGENERTFNFSVPESYAYIEKVLKA